VPFAAESVGGVCGAKVLFETHHAGACTVFAALETAPYLR
jgi:hypothetical protein